MEAILMDFTFNEIKTAEYLGQIPIDESAVEMFIEEGYCTSKADCTIGKVKKKLKENKTVSVGLFLWNQFYYNSGFTTAINFIQQKCQPQLSH